MPEKLTVLIPCKNEADNIRACIESVRGLADEILVADSLSTDNTRELVRQLGGCRIVEREFIDHASFKNWAIPQASHPWVLMVDADERVTAELAAEIRAIMAHDNPALDAYRMRFESFFSVARFATAGGTVRRRSGCFVATHVATAPPGCMNTWRCRQTGSARSAASSCTTPVGRFGIGPRSKPAMRSSGPKTAMPPAGGQAGWESSPGPRCDSSNSTCCEEVFSTAPPG